MPADANSTDDFVDNSLPGFAAGESDTPAPGDRQPGGATTADEIISLWSDVVSAGSDPDARIKPRAAPSMPVNSHLAVKQHSLADAPAKAAPSGESAPDFELLSPLGEGGMGMVYEARQTSMDRTIAIKMLKPHLASNPLQRDKFLSEAAVTSDLDHPNIVPIHDLGVSDNGRLYYAMKRVKGTPWDQVIRDKSREENIEILLGVCNAVAFAHAKGVIHRDLKPQNIMLGEFGEVYVMDWGLAVSVDRQGKAEPLTRNTAAGGTPAYMAPEMAFANANEIGRCSDIYMLGGILFEILTGSPPHPGGKVITCLMNAANNKIAGSRETGELMDIARKAMSTRPADRFQSVRDFQQALRQYQAHAQSIRMTEQAVADLAQATSTSDYSLFSRTVFGLEEAMRLWEGNARAREEHTRACLEYARSAMLKGDFDLARSLLDPGRAAHADLLQKVDAAQAERRQRLMLFRVFKTAAALLVSTIFVILSASYIMIRREKDKAVQAEAAAIRARDRAREQRAEAIRARLAEAEQRAIAEQQTAKAEQAEQEQRRLRLFAEAAREKAQKAKRQAEQALQAMLEARSREEAARAKARAAELVATRAETALSRTGMLLDSSWWTFGPDRAGKLQADAARKTGLPVQRTILLPGAVKLELILIPSGEFVMGSPATEPNRSASEYLHRVKIASAFYLGKYELTASQWNAIMGRDQAIPAPGSPVAEKPKVEISWQDVQTVLMPRLNRHAPAGFVFRLPTEAEWEYACRAGTATAFNTGGAEADMAGAGWYYLNSRRRISVVGKKHPNNWGLCDMHGNVSEWCLDRYDPLFYLHSPQNDPVASTSRKNAGCVMRGGSCMNLAKHCRSAYRSWAHPNNQYKFLGVRVAMVRKQIVPTPGQ